MPVTRDPATRAPAQEPAPRAPSVGAPQAGAPAASVQTGLTEPPHVPPRARWAAPRATALALLAIGVIALVATFAVPSGAESPWAPSGTRFFPLAVSIGLILFSLAFLARVTVWPDTELGSHAAEEAAETDWMVPAFVAAGLIAYVVLIEPLGYVVASTLFFPFGARVLGSRSLLRDVVAGAGLAMAVYFLFTRMLGVPLPPGLLGV
jgi:putative tricarboxylic transport membrane protein